MQLQMYICSNLSQDQFFDSNLLCYSLPLACPPHLACTSPLDLETADCNAVRRFYARVPALEPSIYDSCASRALPCLACAMLPAICYLLFCLFSRIFLKFPIIYFAQFVCLDLALLFCLCCESGLLFLAFDVMMRDLVGLMNLFLSYSYLLPCL
jgi:hypothetical protein